MEKVLFKVLLPLAAFGLIGIGVLHCSGIAAIDGRIYFRAGAGVIGLGIALLAYWAFANRNSDYNF